MLVLWGIGLCHCDRNSFTPKEFLDILAEAFSAESESFTADVLDDGTANLLELERLDTLGYEGWECRIARQFMDLNEMAANGQLKDEMRYFGINSPRGSRWYNFDPCTFLECAMTGSFGGWQEGDGTGRKYVPGEVAVMGPDGQITSCDPRDIPDSIVPLTEISWEQFRDFLGNGQWYE